MGCLWIRDCNHCKNLSEAVSIGVCDIAHHKVEKYGDGEYAIDCPHYENKWGLEEDEQG